MKISHWELLDAIYKYQKSPTRMMEHQVNKSLLKTCYKNQWIEKLEDESIIVTEIGMEEAKKHEYGELGIDRRSFWFGTAKERLTK